MAGLTHRSAARRLLLGANELSSLSPMSRHPKSSQCSGLVWINWYMLWIMKKRLKLIHPMTWPFLWSQRFLMVMVSQDNVTNNISCFTIEIEIKILQLVTGDCSGCHHHHQTWMHEALKICAPGYCPRSCPRIRSAPRSICMACSPWQGDRVDLNIFRWDMWDGYLGLTW